MIGMRNLSIFTNVAFVFLLSAWSGLESNVLVGKEQNNQMVRLIGYQLNNDSIRIKVVSRGCTSANNFHVARSAKVLNALMVVQTKIDDCTKIPVNVDLDYSMVHLKMDYAKPIRVLYDVVGNQLASLD